MPIRDFTTYAAPWLDALQNDPSKPEPSNDTDTSFPGPAHDLSGKLFTIETDDDSRIAGEGNDDSRIGGAVNDTADEGDVASARSAYPMVGLDVLAFYKSFRFVDRRPFQGTWGIFLIDVGVEGLTRDFQEFAPLRPRNELRQLAIATLLAHERYHFWIDAWALGQEIAPLWTKTKRYVHYLAEKQPNILTLDDFEESLANHYTFQKLKRWTFSDGSTASRILRKALSKAPIPYSDFSFGPDERARREGLLALAIANGANVNLVLADMVFTTSARSDASVLSASIQPVEKWHPIAGSPRCPSHFVKVTQYSTSVQPFQGPKLDEFRQFITRYLAGGLLPRTDHEYYRIDNGEKVKAPNPHAKEVRGDELKGTLHKAGMAHKEFIEARIQTKTWRTNCPRNPVKPPLKPSPT